MKYLFFISAVLGMLPAVLVLICERYLIRLAALGLILPLTFFNSTSINFFSKETYRGTSRGLEISIIYIIAVILICTLFIIKGWQKPFPDRGSRIYLLYFLCGLPSLYNAGGHTVSIFEIWKMIMIYLVFIALYYYLKYSEGDFDIIIYGAAFLVTVNFFKILYQHFSGFYQPKGIFPHQNSMAMFMMMTALLFFSRYFNNREKWKSTLFFIVFGMAAVALVRTYSRGAIACFPIAGMITVLCSLRYTFSARKMYVTAFIGIVAIAAILFFIPRIVERFQTAPSASAQTRKNLALSAKNMIVDKPIIGVGINNWGIKINPPFEYNENRAKRLQNQDSEEEFKDGIVETVYLLIGAECGLPCLILFLCWMGYYWVISLKLVKKLQTTKYFYIPAASLGGLTGVMLQSTLEWVLKQQINFMQLVTVFAFISYLNHHYRELVAAAQAPQPDPARIEEKA